MFNQVIERLTADSTPTPLISARRAEHEEENRKRGLKLSVIVHVLLFLIFIFPFLSSPFPPIGQEGIVINFGDRDTGQGDTQPLTEDTKPEASSTASASEPIADATPPPSKPLTPTQTAPQKREAPAPQVRKEVVTTDKSDTPSIKKEQKKKQEEAAKKAKAEADKKAKEARELAEAKEKSKQEEAKKKAAEAKAKRKAEEAERKKKAKEQFGFPGKNDSKGQGNTGEPGDQGKDDGDPDAENLEGEQSGKGQTGIGIDLAGRTPTNRPVVEDNSNKTGKVKVKICVDQKGKVISSEHTIVGSTTQDSKLVRLAENKAKEFRFNADSDALEKQCGSILFTFTVE